MKKYITTQKPMHIFKRKPQDSPIMKMVNEYRAKKIAPRISHSWIPRIDKVTGKVTAFKREY